MIGTKLMTKAVCAWETEGMETGSLPWPSHRTHVPATATPPGLLDQQESRPRENQVPASPDDT